MDDELRELEQAGQKMASAIGKGMHYTEEMLRPLLDASGKVLSFAGSKVAKADRIQRERKAEKKAEKKARKAAGNVSDNLKKTHFENFSFTGKETDLCYFYNTDRMPLSAISGIPDEGLKKTVAQNLDRMCRKKKGLIRIEGNEIVITEKGKELLQDKKFQQKAMNDQLEAHGTRFEKMFGQAPERHQQMCVALNGDGLHDFAFFTKADTLNLSQIAMNPNGNLKEKIMQNVKLWQQQGFVDVKDGIATITDKGKEFLKDGAEALKNAAKDMTEKAVDGIRHTADSVIVTTKTAVRQAAEKAVEATKTATKAAAKAAKKAAKIL